MTETMTYSESASGKMITYQRAIRELKRHGLRTNQGSQDRREFEDLCWHKHAIKTGAPWDHVIDAKYVLAFLGY